MQHVKKYQLAIAFLVTAALALMLIACAGGEQASAEAQSQSVNNDSVTFSDNGTTSDPTAGATTGTVTSEDITWDSLGSAQPPEPYSAPGDLASLVLGEPPVVSHGDSNGDSCTTCHESGVGGAPALTASHLEAGLSDTYCRNCHTNAS